jgi:hypothetical protein
MISLVSFRGMTRFDIKGMCWNSSVVKQHASVSANVFDKLNDSYQKSSFVRLCYQINDEIRRNDLVVNLIGLIILFRNTNAVTDESDKKLTQRYYNIYNNLLRR